jgi:hypothetical protein
MALAAGVAPLAIIPRIEVSIMPPHPWRRAAIIAGIVLSAALTAALLVHFFYRPLDVLWFVLMRRVGLGA